MDHPEPINKTTLTLVAAMTLVIALYFGSTNILGTQLAMPSPAPQRSTVTQAPPSSFAVIAPSSTSTPAPITFAADETDPTDDSDGSAVVESPTPMLWTAFTPMAPIQPEPAIATSPPNPPPPAASRRGGSPTTRPRPPTNTPHASAPRPAPVVPRAATSTPAPAATNMTAAPAVPLPTHTALPLPPTVTPKPANTPLPIIPTVTNTAKATAVPTSSRQPTPRVTAAREADDD